jgi:hypothetical protein
MLGELGENLLVDAIQPIHESSCATDCRNTSVHATNYAYISNARCLIAPKPSHTVDL